MSLEYTILTIILPLLLSKQSIASILLTFPSSTPYLYKRADNSDDDNNSSDGMFLTDDPNSSSWQWGRWILFVLFIVGIFVLFIFTVTTNRRRRYMGQAPIRGTAWMTPPSYRQSEQEYHGNSQRVVEDFVPEYTQEANINDLGYYDERGEFHANGKAEYLPPPPLVQEVDLNDSLDMERPARAVVHDTPAISGNGNNNIPTSDFDYTRPSYAAQQYYNRASRAPTSPFMARPSYSSLAQETSTSSADSVADDTPVERSSMKPNSSKKG